MALPPTCRALPRLPFHLKSVLVRFVLGGTAASHTRRVLGGGHFFHQEIVLGRGE